MPLKDHYVPRAGLCPACGGSLSGALGGDAPPQPGDVAVCSYCGAVNVFGPNLTVAAFPAWRETLAAEEAALVVRAIRAVRIAQALYPHRAPELPGRG